MPSERRHRRLTAWIALVAMLAFALVPTLSRAIGSMTGGAAWSEVCTPQGVLWLSADGEPAPASGVQPTLEHCSFCQLAAEGAAPLPAAVAAIALPLASAATPALFLQAAVTLFAWRSAQPRGPPPSF